MQESLCIDSDLPAREKKRYIRGSYEIKSLPLGVSEGVRNIKASLAMSRTQYFHIDSTITVDEMCRRNEWSRVKIIQPDYLRAGEGWVPSVALQTLNDLEYALETSDFDLSDIELAPHLPAVLAGAQLAKSTIEDCKQFLHPLMTSYKTDDSSPTGHSFRIVCGSPTLQHFVYFYFNESDVANGVIPTRGR